jgi:cystathionine beta-synthase
MLGALLTGGSGDTVFSTGVKDVMVSRLETISADAPIADLVPLFRKEYVAIVMDQSHFLGIATRMDLINYFRVKQQ